MSRDLPQPVQLILTLAMAWAIGHDMGKRAGLEEAQAAQQKPAIQQASPASPAPGR